MGFLVSLQRFEAPYNAINNVDPSFANLTGLTYLDLRGNLLSTIPAIGNYIQLNYLLFRQIFKVEGVNSR